MKKYIKYPLFFIIFLLIVYVSINIYARLMPKLPIKSANSYYMYDKDNNLFNGANNNWVNINNISKHLINATISSEDKNFYTHHGFDIPRIIKAFSTNVKNKKNIQGASTITQQLSKNLFLSFDKTWNRKLEEAILTLRIESHYKKKDILESYLNTINYGGIFGIENASQYYFNKKSKDLSLAEATILAGIPKSPSNYSPISNYKNAKKRQKIILNLMVKNKYITQKEADNAYQEKIEITGATSKEKSNLIGYFEDAVLNELNKIDSIPKSLIDTKGLKIYTTLDPNALKILEDNINKYITDPNLEISSVIIDPNNGNIKAIAGGKNYIKSQFNRVINSKRQVGSTIKPILYYAALENGFTPSTTFTSEKTNFNLGNNKTYSPNNYNNIYKNGPISMSAAIAYSDNIYAVKTHIFLGEDTLIDTAKKLGIKTQLKPNISLALGTSEINILEMINAYSTFANTGYIVTPHFITKVEDMDGNILYKFKEKKSRVLNEDSVFVLNELLTSSYDPSLLDYNTPTCLAIKPKMSKKYAIKTGTTDTDHLIFGYNKDILMGIWMGYDDNKKIEVSVGNAMKNIWIDTMENYLTKDSWYKVPKGVVGVLVNPITGKLATKEDNKTKILYYIKGTEPYE